MDVLERIEQLRKEKGWTYYRLSYEAGLTQSTLTNMTARNTLPSVSTLMKICEALGISMSEFFSEPDQATPRSGGEKELIENFRKLSDKDKRAVIALCKNLSESNVVLPENKA